jgi:hypothetical protein
MHIKRNKNLFHLKSNVFLWRIILLHNTNIASFSLLVTKLKYIQKMLLNTKKHRKSLSPEQKGEVMTINAAAHKKQYELLPPEKKARLMETKTEQCHEHLTEEEKKISTQIRSIAATLYERVYLNKPTVEFLHEHFYKDPTLASAYFYCFSTDPRVAIFNDKLQLDVDGSVIWNRISNLIRSPIG